MVSPHRWTMYSKAWATERKRWNAVAEVRPLWIYLLKLNIPIPCPERMRLLAIYHDYKCLSMMSKFLKRRTFDVKACKSRSRLWTEISLQLHFLRRQWHFYCMAQRKDGKQLDFSYRIALGEFYSIYCWNFIHKILQQIIVTILVRICRSKLKLFLSVSILDQHH